MRFSNYIKMGCCLFMFANMSIAGSHPVYESALTPGAKLLAGDPAKNEFYIVSGDKPFVKPQAVTTEITASQKKNLVQVRNLAKDKKVIRDINTALKQTHVRIVMDDKTKTKAKALISSFHKQKIRLNLHANKISSKQKKIHA